MTTRTIALRLLGMAGIGSLVAITANAQDGGYYYGGASIGQSRARIDEERITASLLAGGLRTTAMTKDERSTGYKLFGGYQFNRNIALEAGYFDLGRFGFTSTTLPTGTLNGQIRLQGVNLDLVGSVPLSERWSVLGRVGAQSARARDNFTGSGAVIVSNPNPSKRDTGYKFGAGLQYAFTPSLLVRAEGERYRVNDAVGNHGTINLFSLSLVFPFGRAPAATPRPVAVAPAYVAPAPAPAPAPMPAPEPAPAVIAVAPVAMAPVVVPPARRRVTFSAGSLFTFDESVIRPEGRSALDQFMTELAGTQYDVINVEGHTDRLGSDAYNLKLSSQRAAAVKNYLVATGGLDAAKISAVGQGESSPVTKPEDCKGTKPTPKLIACLQPDRRVVVEVVGTR